MQLPGPVRAVVGLVASAADEARHLPDRAIELPMLAVSSALQVSLRAQQRYARLTARGDDVLNRRRPTDEPPSWATFDAPVDGLDDPDPQRRARAASKLLDELLGGPGGDAAAGPPASASPRRSAAPRSAKQPARKAPAKRSTAKKAEPKKVNRPRHTKPSRFDTVDDD